MTSGDGRALMRALQPKIINPNPKEPTMNNTETAPAMTESVGVIADTNRLFEATLYENDQIRLDVQDATDSVDVSYTLDEARQIMAAIGHLLWLADNRE